MLWKGKVFYRKERLLRNRIEDTTLLKPLIEGDLNTIQKITVGGKDQWLLFPARLYCGQSLLDSRRESIIIDYFFTDELPGYRQRPDYLAGRNGLKVRDEIRMVRPGLYLGRAYIGQVFLVNFFLYSKEIAGRDGPGVRENGRGAGGLLVRARRPAPPSRRSNGARAAGSRAMRGWLLVALAMIGAQPCWAQHERAALGGRPGAVRDPTRRLRGGRSSTSWRRPRPAASASTISRSPSSGWLSAWRRARAARRASAAPSRC